MNLLPADIVILKGINTGSALIMTAAIIAFVMFMIRRNRKS